MKEEIKKETNYNVFIMYKGDSKVKGGAKQPAVGTNQPEEVDGSLVNLQSGGSNPKYIGALLFYELSKSPDCTVFFGPRRYVVGDDFLKKITPIMSTVVVAIIIVSPKMFDVCITPFGEVDESATLFQEMKHVLTNIVEDNIMLINTGHGVNLKQDDSYKKVYNRIRELAIKEQKKEPVHIENMVQRDFVDNEDSFFQKVVEEVESDIRNTIHNTKYKAYTSHCINMLKRGGSSTKTFAMIIDFIFQILNRDAQFKEENEDLFAYLIDKDSDMIDMTKLHEEVSIWVDEISKIGHFGGLRKTFKEAINSDSGEVALSLEDVLLSTDEEKALEAIEVYKEIYGKKDKVFKEIGKRIIVANDKVLTYSSSARVLSFIDGVRPRHVSTVTLFVCETRIKSPTAFMDALATMKDLEKKGFKKVLITDNSAFDYVQNKKVNKICLGACFLRIKDGVLVELINTSGSEVLAGLAAENGIPVYVICSKSKGFDYEEENVIRNNIEERLVAKMLADKDGGIFVLRNDEELLDGDPERKIWCDEIDYARFYRTDNIIFVSEDGEDNRELFAYFRDDLWKDDRVIKVMPATGLLTKSCPKSYAIEKSFFEYIKDTEAYSYIPQVLQYNDESSQIKMQKIEGVRLFEFFVALDELAKIGVFEASRIKKKLLHRCCEQQRCLIDALTHWYNETQQELSPYPAQKVVDMIQNLYKSVLMYYSSYPCNIDYDELCKEAETLYEDFVSYSDSFIPFRDSTIKNMILEIPELAGKDRIVDEVSLRQFVKDVYDYISCNNAVADIVGIVDIDFSSIINTTSKYDDVVGLLMHERSYLKENEDVVLNVRPEDQRSLATAFFVRMLRFGGRKRMYRLVSPQFHDVRFRYDDEMYYFRQIVEFIPLIDGTFYEDYPVIKQLFDTLCALPNRTPKFDLWKYKQKTVATPWLGLWAGEDLED